MTHKNNNNNNNNNEGHRAGGPMWSLHVLHANSLRGFGWMNNNENCKTEFEGVV